MEAKAIKFVKIIRRKLKSEPEFEGVPLEKLFLRSVETLPDGEFKTELLGNLARYRKLLTHKKSVLQPFSGYPERNGPSLASVETQKKTYSLKPEVSSGSTKTVKQAKFSGPAELQWMADIRRTVTLTCVFSVTNDVLQTMMKLYTSKLTEHLTEDLLCGLKQNGLTIVGQELKRFLHFCNHGYTASEEFQRPPTYHDLIAALLSVYVDVTLLSTRSKDAEERRRESRQLVDTVAYLLRRRPGHVLDVLLQQTQATSADSVTLLPLYRKALGNASMTHDPALYTKYMLAAHQAIDLFVQESSTLREPPDVFISETCAKQFVPTFKGIHCLKLCNESRMALQVAAPAGYFEWLRDQNVYVPEIEYMRGAAVSKVLLRECDADTLGLLMDVLTDDTRMDDSSDCLISGAPDTADYSENTDKPETAAMTANEQPLFFMDKVASKLPIDLEPVDIDLERVVENDACVESGNHHGVEETESLLAISSESDDLGDAAEPISGEVDRDSGTVECTSKDVDIGQQIDISSGPDTDSDAGPHPNRPEPLSGRTKREKRLSSVAERHRGIAKRNGDSDDELQMFANTPNHRIRTYTRRSMSLRKSPKKSASAKTPQRIDTDEEVVDFTGLRSTGTPLRSPTKPSRTADIVAPSGGSDDHQEMGVASRSTQDESDDDSVVLVTPQASRRHSCRLRTLKVTVDRLKVDEIVTLLHKKEGDTNDVSGRVTPNVSDNVDMHKETYISDGKGGEKPLFFIDKKAGKLPAELRPAVTGKTEGDVIAVETNSVTPTSRRQSGVTTVLSAVKSQKTDRSKRKTPKRMSVDANNSNLTRLKPSELDSVSFSSPVLTSGGGRRSKKSRANTISDDLDESWVVIDTPIRNSRHPSKYPGITEHVEDEDAIVAKDNAPALVHRGVKQEPCKSTPHRRSAAVSRVSASACKRKSLAKGETPNEDANKSDIESTHWLRQRRKSTLT